MIKYLMLWYRAKTYCPVIESLRDEPELWMSDSAYEKYKTAELREEYEKKMKGKPRRDSYYNPRFYTESYSLYHRDLGIQIKYATYATRDKEVLRNGHSLPVSRVRLDNALKDREFYFEKKKKEAARAELNRVTQDAQTLRLARIAKLRKELAEQEAADIAYRIENA